MKNLPKIESGQALLLVLLSMAVVVTIVLSILSRSVTDIKVSSVEKESLRAFSAAEAGVEQALIVGSSTGNISLGEASFNAEITSFASGGKEFVSPTTLLSGENFDTWLVAHDENGNLTCDGDSCFTGNKIKVCWGRSGTSADAATTPALEISFFYTEEPGDFSTVKIAREAVDPNSGRRATNHFSAPDAGGCQIAGEDFAFQKTLNLTTLGISGGVFNQQNGLQLMRSRPIYNVDLVQPVAVNVDFGGNSLLPSQGVKINSQGTSGDANRQIEVFQGFAEPPPIFSVVAFSGGGITK